VIAVITLMMEAVRTKSFVKIGQMFPKLSRKHIQTTVITYAFPFLPNESRLNAALSYTSIIPTPTVIVTFCYQCQADSEHKASGRQNTLREYKCETGKVHKRFNRH
jgi:hypothetical protein